MSTRIVAGAGAVGARGRPATQRRTTTGTTTATGWASEVERPLGFRRRPRTRFVVPPRALNADDAQVPVPYGNPAPTTDPYFLAGQRLDRLLSGLGDGEDELLDQMLSEQTVEKKVGLAALAGGLVVVASVTCCLFLDLDPFGGMRSGMSTVVAALTGALVSVPLAVFKNALWTEDADAQLPFLKELQRTQINDFTPILTGLSPVQCAIILACEVVPTVFIVYPAFVGGITSMLEGYRAGSEALANSVPETLPPLVALSIVALLSGVSKLIDQGPSPEEYDVIKDALENADRYYKVMAGPGENNKSSEEAFKSVSLMWLARRQVSARFAGALSSFEIFYLGMLWLETGDLAAPLVAALALNAVDFVKVYDALPRERERR